MYAYSLLHNCYMFRRYYFALFKELTPTSVYDITAIKQVTINIHIARLRQQCHNSKSVIFQEQLLKGFEVL